MRSSSMQAISDLPVGATDTTKRTVSMQGSREGVHDEIFD